MLEPLIIVSLASWRLAFFLVNERGLFRIGDGIRWLAGVRVEERVTAVGGIAYPHQTADSETAKLFTCMYCMTVWTPLLYLLWHTDYAVVVWLLAIAALSLLIHKVHERV